MDFLGSANERQQKQLHRDCRWHWGRAGWDQTPAENEKWEGRRKLMGFAFITGSALGKIDTHCKSV